MILYGPREPEPVTVSATIVSTLAEAIVAASDELRLLGFAVEPGRFTVSNETAEVVRFRRRGRGVSMTQFGAQARSICERTLHAELAIEAQHVSVTVYAKPTTAMWRLELPRTYRRRIELAETYTRSIAAAVMGRIREPAESHGAMRSQVDAATRAVWREYHVSRVCDFLKGLIIIGAVFGVAMLLGPRR